MRTVVKLSLIVILALAGLLFISVSGISPFSAALSGSPGPQIPLNAQYPTIEYVGPWEPTMKLITPEVESIAPPVSPDVSNCTGGTCFWIGGTGNFSSTAHWAIVSGGVSCTCTPGSTDNVTFDAASGAGTATQDNASFTSAAVTMTNSSVTVAGSSNTWLVGGNWTDASAAGKFSPGTSNVDFTATATLSLPTAATVWIAYFYQLTIDATKTATVSPAVGAIAASLLTINGTFAAGSSEIGVLTTSSSGSPVTMGASGSWTRTTSGTKGTNWLACSNSTYTITLPATGLSTSAGDKFYATDDAGCTPGSSTVATFKLGAAMNVPFAYIGKADIRGTSTSPLIILDLNGFAFTGSSATATQVGNAAGMAGELTTSSFPANTTGVVVTNQSSAFQFNVTGFMVMGSGLWRVRVLTWTNNSTSASWNAGTGTFAFINSVNGTLNFSATPSNFVGGVEFNNLVFDTTSATPGTIIYTTATSGFKTGGNVTILNTISGGAVRIRLTLGAFSYSVGGSWDSSNASAEMIPGTSTVTFTGTALKTVIVAPEIYTDVSGSGFYNLTVGASAVLKMTSSIEVFNNLVVTGTLYENCFSILHQSGTTTGTPDTSCGPAVTWSTSVTGLTASFTSTVSNSASPYTYAWNFGDGATSTSANPSHAYSANGEYNVALAVTDSASRVFSAPGGTVDVAAVYNSLIKLTSISPDVNCPASSNGETKVESGLDNGDGGGIGGDGILQAGEVDSTAYVCGGLTGATGPAGHNSLITVTSESAGANCATGGEKLQAGVDTNDSGVLDAGEVQYTAYVCNGLTGHNALVISSDEPAGANCPAGGTRIDAGTDTNDDNILEGGEITTTGFACNASVVVNSGITLDWIMVGLVLIAVVLFALAAAFRRPEPMILSGFAVMFAAFQAFNDTGDYIISGFIGAVAMFVFLSAVLVNDDSE